MKIEKINNYKFTPDGAYERAEKINELISAFNEMSEDNFRYEEGYSDGYAAGKEDVSGAEDELKLGTLDELKLKYDHLVGIDDPYDVDEFWADVERVCKDKQEDEE